MDPEKLANEIEAIILDPTTLCDADDCISIAAPMVEWVYIIARLRETKNG